MKKQLFPKEIVEHTVEVHQLISLFFLLLAGLSSQLLVYVAFCCNILANNLPAFSQ